MEEIRILQLGEEDWNRIYTLPQWVRLDHVEHFRENTEKRKTDKPYDMFFLDRTPQEEEISSLLDRKSTRLNSSHS